MQSAKTQKTVDIDGLDIKILGVSSASNIPEFHSLCRIERVIGVVSPTPAGVADYPTAFIVNIEYSDGKRVEFDIQDVTNQPGWSANVAGLTQAVNDIKAWKVTACQSTALVGGPITVDLNATDDEVLVYVSPDGGLTRLPLKSDAAGNIYLEDLYRFMPVEGNLTSAFFDAGFLAMSQAVDTTALPSTAIGEAMMLRSDKDSGELLVRDLSSQVILSNIEFDVDNINTVISALAKSEDVPHVNGDVGIMALAVRNDSAATSLAGADGDYSPISVDDKGSVHTRLSQPLPAGENHIGSIGGNTFTLSVTQATTATTYAAGDAVGGKITITNAMRVSGGTGVLQSIQIIDKGNQKAALELLIFDSDPTAATITNDAAFAYSTDLSKQIARIPIAASDYTTIDSKATVSLGGIGKVLKASGSTNLYAALVTTGTPTYASTSDIIITFGILQD